MEAVQQQHENEVNAGDRFEFGANWALFLKTLNNARIDTAIASLQKMIGLESFSGRTFIDIGSGSGLFSLAARKLGAKVHSFDFDTNSFNCTCELRRRYFPDDREWIVEQGSVLDPAYLKPMGSFDIVYSWGVLHHTGQMWQALENVVPLVKEGGYLFIAIYNDQGTPSRRWRKIKTLYNRLPSFLRWTVLWPCAIYLWWLPCLRDLRHGHWFKTWRDYSKERGMSPWRDVVDWVGGYPFEVAQPDEIFLFYKQRGFQMVNMPARTTGHGCNEFVFRRVPPVPCE